MGVLQGITDTAEESSELLASISAIFTSVSAISFIVFNLLCAPCFAAIGAIKREMGEWKWTFIAVGYQCLLAYAVSFMIYQLGSVFVLGTSFGIGTILAIFVLIGMLYLLFRSCPGDKLQNKVTVKV